MTSQHDKAERFRALHETGCFLIPNPWDPGSARLLAAMGFEALATTSAGAAFALGRVEGVTPRQEAVALAGAIAQAVDLPVSADLENGFGDRPEDAAETVRAAAEAGLVGCSIEDATGRKDSPIYERALAVEKVAAAVEAARGLSFPFMLTARAENFLHSVRDLDDTIERLLAFEAAGADVLYAPGLGIAEIRAVCAAVSRPVNALARADVDVATLAEAGVRRISVGSGLYRSAMATALGNAQAMRAEGRLDWLAEAAPFAAFEECFRARR